MDTDTAIQQINEPERLPDIPEGWDAKADLIDRCFEAGRRLTIFLAVVVARAREDFDTPTAWIDACVERWAWDRKHVSHMGRIGNYIVQHSRPGVVYNTLTQLPFDHALKLTQLPPNLLRPFCERAPGRNGPLHLLQRDDFRDLVDNWRKAAGEPVDDPDTNRTKRRGKNALSQMDFLDSLFAAALDDARRDSYVADGDIPATKAAVGGLLLLDVAVRKLEAVDGDDLDINDIETMLDDLDRTRARAQTLLSRAGRRLLTTG